MVGSYERSWSRTRIGGIPGGEGGGDKLLLFLLLFLVLIYQVFFEFQNFFLVCQEHLFLVNHLLISFDYWVFWAVNQLLDSLSVKSGNILKNKLQRILSSYDIFTDWVQFPSKASIVNSVSCNVITDVCLYLR